MASARKAPRSQKKQEDTECPESASLATALSVRLWIYRAGQGKLRDFLWKPEGVVADLVNAFVRDNQGKLVEADQNILLARFEKPLHAVSAAKSLLDKLINFGLDSSEEHVVASAAVHSWLEEKAPPENADGASQAAVSGLLLKGSSPLQILVTQRIYDLTRNEACLEFSKCSAAGAEENGAPGVYELLWTDEATYARVRLAIREPEAATPAISRYAIQSQLGQGSMGVVYKAQDRFINRTVALKTISLGNGEIDRGELIERLRQEAKAAGSLDHPNIITIYDVAEEDDTFYMSMQYVEGATLSSMLAGGTLLPLPVLLAYIDQICSAVSFAHAHGVIHRDLKPSNLMLNSAGVIKVLDFGIAKLGDAGLTQAGMVIGTPGYMAPEQAAGRRVDHRSDIFSLGAVFYEFFTGEKAFGGQSITSVLYKVMNEDPVPPSVIEPSLPRGIDAILQRALAKDPGQRFQSCEEMRAAFRTQAALLESSAKPESSASIPVPVAAGANGMSATGLFSDHARTSHDQAVAPLPPLAQPAAGAAPEVSGAVTVRQAKRFVWIGLATSMIAVVAVFFIIQSTRIVRAKDRQSGQAAVPVAVPGTPDGGAQNAQPAWAAASSNSPSSASATPASAVPASSIAAQETGLPASRAKTEPPKHAADSGASAASKKPKRESSRAKTVLDQPDQAEQGDDLFQPSEIPDLIRRADADRGSGNYERAKIAYNHVLRMDKQNAEAREGLRRIEEAEKEKRP